MGEIYITYKNSKNEVKGYHIEVTNETDKHVEGRDVVANKWKKFNKSRIVAHHETLDDAIREANEQQKNYTIRTPRFQIEQNDGSKTEICITGYDDEDKDYLKALAEESGKFIVRTNVTKKVSVLLVGSSPGWSKIEKATEKGAVLIKDPDDAVRFLQTGELPS
jgi:hypothetical protein